MPLRAITGVVFVYQSVAPRRSPRSELGNQVRERGGELWVLDGDGHKASTNGVYTDRIRIAPNKWVNVPASRVISLGNPASQNGIHISIIRSMPARQIPTNSASYSTSSVGTPEKESASPPEHSHKKGSLAARNRGYTASSALPVPSREMCLGVVQSNPARYKVLSQA